MVSFFDQGIRDAIKVTSPTRPIPKIKCLAIVYLILAIHLRNNEFYMENINGDKTQLVSPHLQH